MRGVCIESSFGRSNLVELNRIVMQGPITGGMMCPNQTSKLCTKTFKEGSVYMYRKKIPIPTLAMADVIALIAVCNSADALAANIKTNTFIQRKETQRSR